MGGSIVTFYSYKGGVGRTFLLANVAVLLSKWGYRVLCVDWDLEAPGLHQYFQLDRDRSGLLDMVLSCAEGPPIHWNDLCQHVGIPGAESTALNVITAGRLDDGYVLRVQALDWARLYSECGFGRLLEHWATDWRDAFDFVLLDSPSGLREGSAICTAQLADFLVLPLVPNQQSVEGTMHAVQRAMNERHRLHADKQRPLVLPVLSRVSMFDERTKSQQWLDVMSTELAPFYEAWAPKDVSPRDLVPLFLVPFSPYWSFGENLPVLEESASDPRNVAHSITTIASVIARRFVGVGELLSGRHQYVGATPRRAARYQIFISYDREDDERATQIAEELERRGVSVWKDTVDLNPGEGLLAKIREAVDRSHGLVWLAPRLARPETFQYLELSLFLAKRAWSPRRILMVVTLESSRIAAIPRYVNDFARIDGEHLAPATVAERIAAALPEEA